MQHTLYYVQEIEKYFPYADNSAKCIASFIYEKYFADIKLINNKDKQTKASLRELDGLYTIYLILMLCHNLDNKDVCLNLEDFFKQGGVFESYKAYEKESIRVYDLTHGADHREFCTIDFNQDLFNAYLLRVLNGDIECIVSSDNIKLHDTTQYNDGHIQSCSQTTHQDEVAQSQTTDSISYDDTRCEKPLVYSLGRLYIRRNYLYESYIAQYIVSKGKNTSVDEDLIKGILPRLFVKHNDDLNHQLLCALLSIYQGFSIISGGPGTGKTTTVLKLLFLQLYLNQGRSLDIRLCAPTGKAAGRMKESIVSGLRHLKEQFKDDSTLISLVEKIPTEAFTIHSLIGVMPRSSKTKYNENNKLAIDILIVDEVSMVDMALFVKLLKAIENKTIVIMLGDKDQLCSVEAGSVLGDICQAFFNNRFIAPDTLDFIARLSGYDVKEIKEHGAISEYVGLLKKSHRFKEGSSIYNLAMQVNAPLDGSYKSEDKIHDLQLILQSIKDNKGDAIALYEIESEKKDFNTKAIVEDITAKALMTQSRAKAELNDGRGSYEAYLQKLYAHNFCIDNNNQGGLSASEVFDAMNKFRILCSNRDGDLGCNRLSYAIESAVKRKYGFADSEFFPGRIILITRNNKILNLNNGDVGFVACDLANKGTDKEKNLYVWFVNTTDGKAGAARIPIAFLDSYESAFCMTIHKSQGSEYEHVLIALSTRYNEVLTKELIYTAITRAKEYVSFIYNKDIFYKACLDEVKRQSGLSDRLLRAIE